MERTKEYIKKIGYSFSDRYSIGDTVIRIATALCIFLAIAFFLPILSQMYFTWLLPLKNVKDWVVFFLLIPLSSLVLFSYILAVIVSIMVVPDNKYNVIMFIITLIVIGGWIANIIAFGFKFNGFTEKLNVMQIGIVTIYLIYHSITELYSRRK